MSKWDMKQPVCPKTTAAAMGLIAIEPAEDELQIDIDDPSDLRLVDDMLGLLAASDVGARVHKITESKSGNSHVYLRLDWPGPLDPVTRIALQACFGSDRKRELLSLLRHVFQTQHPPTVFFEKPEVA
jgi:hypothetical protein